MRCKGCNRIIKYPSKNSVSGKHEDLCSLCQGRARMVGPPEDYAFPHVKQGLTPVRKCD
ncbi:hypothetical protein X832_gp159 [Pseudomonas phage PAK_P5]|uniref:Uncharacterized protein n=1 Tax=Pseudomonas phage PAK_P5 TaxID=1327964 RepID=V5JXH9_9CAUD|nr:hypothetical protein X832_gp159 [Pseudomonas phage PAK_P5]AGR89629.1 hypothetical protein PAK_P500162 [Pseudomonas phage PAK_P5]